MGVKLKRVKPGDVIVKIGGSYPEDALLVVASNIEMVDESDDIFPAIAVADLRKGSSSESMLESELSKFRRAMSAERIRVEETDDGQFSVIVDENWNGSEAVFLNERSAIRMAEAVERHEILPLTGWARMATQDYMHPALGWQYVIWRPDAPPSKLWDLSVFRVQGGSHIDDFVSPSAAAKGAARYERTVMRVFE